MKRGALVQLKCAIQHYDWGVSGQTPSAVAELGSLNREEKIDEELCNEVIKILTICDQGKYSPEAIGKEDGIIKEMRILLKQIDRNIS